MGATRCDAFGPCPRHEGDRATMAEIGACATGRPPPVRGPLDLERLERLSAAASPGPWRADRYDRTIRAAGLEDFAVARQPHRAASSPITHEQHRADLELLAVAREAIPELVREVRRLHAASLPIRAANALAEAVADFRLVAAHPTLSVTPEGELLRRVEAVIAMLGRG